jgi:hypothetical protein
MSGGAGFDWGDYDDYTRKRAVFEQEKVDYAQVQREREQKLRQVALAVVLVLTAVMVACGWALVLWLL